MIGDMPEDYFVLYIQTLAISMNEFRSRLVDHIRSRSDIGPSFDPQSLNIYLADQEVVHLLDERLVNLAKQNPTRRNNVNQVFKLSWLTNSPGTLEQHLLRPLFATESRIHILIEMPDWQPPPYNPDINTDTGTIQHPRSSTPLSLTPMQEFEIEEFGSSSRSVRSAETYRNSTQMQFVPATSNNISLLDDLNGLKQNNKKSGFKGLHRNVKIAITVVIVIILMIVSGLLGYFLSRSNTSSSSSGSGSGGATSTSSGAASKSTPSVNHGIILNSTVSATYTPAGSTSGKVVHYDLSGLQKTTQEDNWKVVGNYTRNGELVTGTFYFNIQGGIWPDEITKKVSNSECTNRHIVCVVVPKSGNDTSVLAAYAISQDADPKVSLFSDPGTAVTLYYGDNFKLLC
ncbi:hypothetical protein HK096_010219 [Nowakowskiella sp. JEL0078]|nr:hypothetical protein HK096_010219 [Nowakowskiella sp. JEL0078]